MLITTLMLTSCFGRDDDVHENTLGDDNGDGVIEDGTDDGVGGGNDMIQDIGDGAETLINDIGGGMDNLMNGGETGGRDDLMNGDTETDSDTNEPNFKTVDKVRSADDALNFIGANVYSLCRDVIPIMTETKILTEEEKQSVTYNTGIANTEGIHDIIVSESSLESFAYSFLMIRTDGTNTDTLQSEVGSSINPEAWLGVMAEKIASIKLDDDIVLVMGGSEQVDTIMNSVVMAADGVYDSIGEIISVMG